MPRVSLKWVGRYKLGLLTLPEYSFRAQVSRKMQVGYAYPLSRWIVHHLLRDSRQNLSMKRNSFLTYVFFKIFVSLLVSPDFNTKNFKLIYCSNYFSLERIFPSHSCLTLIFQSWLVVSVTRIQKKKIKKIKKS